MIVTENKYFIAVHANEGFFLYDRENDIRLSNVLYLPLGSDTSSIIEIEA